MNGMLWTVVVGVVVTYISCSILAFFLLLVSCKGHGLLKSAQESFLFCCRWPLLLYYIYQDKFR